jgi:hypothetical protein
MAPATAAARTLILVQRSFIVHADAACQEVTDGSADLRHVSSAKWPVSFALLVRVAVLRDQRGEVKLVNPKPGRSGAATRWRCARTGIRFRNMCDDVGKPCSRRIARASFGPASR